MCLPFFIILLVNQFLGTTYLSTQVDTLLKSS